MFDKVNTRPKIKNNGFSRFEQIQTKGVPESCTVFLNSAYLKAIEDAEIPGLDFRYIPFMENGKCIGFYYFQIINLSSQELGQIVTFEPYNSLISGISMLIQRLLFGVKSDKPHFLIVSGNLLLSGNYGICIHEKNKEETIYRDFPKVIHDLKTELEQKGKVIAEIIKDYPCENDPLLEILKPLRYHPLAMEPIMKMDIRPEWKTISDYVAALSSKYRVRFNQAKKKLEKCEVKTINTAFLIENKERVNEIYCAVQKKSPVHLIHPDVNYIISLSKHMAHSHEMKGIFHEGKLIAFLIGIRDIDHFEAHHIGIDYHFNKDFSLYLNILYLYIEMAIQSGAGQLSFGRTALEIKTTVGATGHTYNAFIKLNNSLLNGIVKKLLPESIASEWIARDPFRK